MSHAEELRASYAAFNTRLTTARPGPALPSARGQTPRWLGGMSASLCSTGIRSGESSHRPSQKGSSIRRTVKSLDGTSQLRLLRASYEGLSGGAEVKAAITTASAEEEARCSRPSRTLLVHPGACRRVCLPHAHQPPLQAAALTSIFLASGCATAGFGTVTVSTPFAMLALMCSGLTPSGSSRDRENDP